jgi:RTA1 like protein
MPSTDDTQHGNPLDCTEVTSRCRVEDSIYGYYANLPANAFFVALFGVCLAVNLAFGIKYKTWTYMVAMSLACLASAIGYAGRILLHSNPFDTIGFQIQICCLTLSPAFNSAAIYLMLKHIVRRFGRRWSRLRPKYYTWGYITADILALILQAAGGGLAATASGNNSQLNTGTNLMIAGICWQVATLVIFGAMVTDFLIRRFLFSGASTPLSPQAQATRNDRNFKIFVPSLVIAYFAVLIRCVYRIAEMEGGWQNPIMQDEVLFIVLDSSMVGLATILQSFVHPGFCFSAIAEPDVISEEKDVSDSSMVQV